MDYTRCIAHYISGQNKGQRCKSKGRFLVFTNSKLKVCQNHYSWRVQYAPIWLQEIVNRGILGRYNDA